MKKPFFYSTIMLFSALLIASCNGNPKTTDTDNFGTTSKGISLDDSKADGLTFEKLRLYPIVASDEVLAANKKIGQVKTLEQALADGSIVITESDQADNYDYDAATNGYIQSDRTRSNSSGGGGAVNTLRYKNTTGQPIFLMAGDVVGGGKQDRIVGEDQLAMGKDKWTDVPVFCVEPHRWEYKENDEDAQNFAVYGNTVASNVRYAAVYEKNQQNVWNEVGSLVSMHNAESSTGSYNELQKSSEYQAEVVDYINHFKGIFDSRTNVIGMIAVSGDKVLGCDIFATNELFKSKFQSLLYAYSTDAFSFGNTAFGTATDTNARNFFRNCMTEYQAPLRERNEDNRKLAYKGVVVHYTNLQVQSDGKGARNIFDSGH